MIDSNLLYIWTNNNTTFQNLYLILLIKQRYLPFMHAVLGFPEPKWNPTFVLLMKGRPIKRRGHPPHKERPNPLKRRRFDTYRNCGAKKYCIYAGYHTWLLVLSYRYRTWFHQVGRSSTLPTGSPSTLTDISCHNLYQVRYIDAFIIT